MIDNESWNLKPGIYRHGSNIFAGGSYGILVVIQAVSYICQIDIVLNQGIYIRTAHDYGSSVDLNWTKL